MAREHIAKGVYICEYKTSLVFPAKSDEQDECHARNTRGMYIMETELEVKCGSGRLCFDATDRLHYPGRYQLELELEKTKTGMSGTKQLV